MELPLHRFTRFLDTLKPGDAYTGVGARVTPRDVGVLMCAFALEARARDLKLRSGAADGADLAFESGAHPVKEIFTPHPRFNGCVSAHVPIPPECYRMAAAVHPAWQSCSGFAQDAHARNVLEVHGAKLEVPSKFLVCYTEHGQDVGGTRTAIVLARNAGIPVLNLGLRSHLALMQAFVRAEYVDAANELVQMRGKGTLRPFREFHVSRIDPTANAAPSSAVPEPIQTSRPRLR